MNLINSITFISYKEEFDMYFRPTMGGNILFTCASMYNDTLFKYFYEKGFEQNFGKHRSTIINKLGDSLLMHSIKLIINKVARQQFISILEIIKILISNNADINFINETTGESILNLAIFCDKSIFYLIFDNVTNVNFIDKFGDSPLIIAIKNNRIIYITSLIKDYGASIDKIVKDTKLMELIEKKFFLNHNIFKLFKNM